jgi:hypothetical protein
MTDEYVDNLIVVANHLLDMRRGLANEMARGLMGENRIERFYQVQLTLEAIVRAMSDEEEVVAGGRLRVGPAR